MSHRCQFDRRNVIAAGLFLAPTLVTDLTAALNGPDERSRIIKILDRLGVKFREVGRSIYVTPDGDNVTGYEGSMIEFRFTRFGVLEHMGIWHESDFPGEPQ